MEHVSRLALVALLSLSAACSGGDDDDDSAADAGDGADASLVEYTEENCDTLGMLDQIPGEVCCYSGGNMAGCDQVWDLGDGTIGCIDQIVDGVPMCAFFECESFPDDVSECE